MSGPAPIRLHVRPRLRGIGERLFRDWLALTVGSHIWAWRPLTPGELAHEVAHVRQWQRYGPRFALLYLRASAAAWRAGEHWYADNAFEREARQAKP